MPPTLLGPPAAPAAQVLAIKREDTGEWSLPGGVVKAGDLGLTTVKRSIKKVGNFKDPAQQEKFNEMVEVP